MGGIRFRSSRHADGGPLFPLALFVRRRTDASELGTAVGADQTDSADHVGAGRRRAELRDAATGSGLSDHSRSALVYLAAGRHERLSSRRDLMQRRAEADACGSQHRPPVGQHDDQRAGDAGGRGFGHPHFALGSWRDRLAAAARASFRIRHTAR